MFEVIALIVGAIFGAVGAIVVLRRDFVGDLRIDDSDPDGLYLFLELKCSTAVVSRKKYVLLKVNPKSYISHD